MSERLEAPGGGPGVTRDRIRHRRSNGSDMIRGLKTSAGALGAASRAQEILANNLANSRATGFRRDQIAFHRLAESTGGSAPAPAPGSPAAAFRKAAADAPSLVQAVDALPGAVETTENPLNLALGGTGFFAVQGPEGELYTRDGALQRSDDGTLLHSSGFPILGDGGPIVLPPGAAFTVAADGSISVDGEARGRLRIVDLPDPRQLKHAGRNLLASEVPGVDAAEPRVLQGALEGSNVEPIDSMVQMMAILRGFEANQRAILTQDGSLARLIQWAAS